jgi:hypothetical protein
MGTIRCWPAVAVTAVLALGLAAAGCTAGREQFQHDAERFLTSDAVLTGFGIYFRDPVCTRPRSTSTGTSFACTARGDDGLTYDVTMQVTGRNAFTLAAVSPMDPAPPSTA